jgi:hypothetical protein
VYDMPVPSQITEATRDGDEVTVKGLRVLRRRSRCPARGGVLGRRPRLRARRAVDDCGIQQRITPRLCRHVATKRVRLSTRTVPVPLPRADRGLFLGCQVLSHSDSAKCINRYRGGLFMPETS